MNTTKNIINYSQRYKYDHSGRLKNVYRQNGIDNEILLSSFKYNELGQLIEKNLHSENQGITFLQSIDYSYNISGKLTAINNSTLSNSSLKSNPVDNNNDINDLFGINLGYEIGLNGVNNTPSYDGSVSAIKYSISNTLISTSERAFKYEYDDLSRLLSASFAIYTAGSFNFSNNSCKESVTYDKNSNIKTLNRYDFASSESSSAVKVDDLTFTYSKSGNQLENIIDAGSKVSFNGRNPSGIAYQYDANGNLVKDINKGIFNISYNHMNQPLVVTFTEDKRNFISYNYDANGKMLSRKIVKNNVSFKTNDYVGSLFYENSGLKYFITQEGRVYQEASGKYGYQYDLRDHLNNVLAIFDKDPSSGKARLLQEDNFYAFGSKIAALSYRASNLAGENTFLYGNKEYQEGLNTTSGAQNDYDWDMYDMGARMYDPILARFHSPDNLTQLAVNISPYAYAFNNPINFNDPTGNWPGPGKEVEELPPPTVLPEVIVTPNGTSYDYQGISFGDGQGLYYGSGGDPYGSGFGYGGIGGGSNGGDGYNLGTITPNNSAVSTDALSNTTATGGQASTGLAEGQEGGKSSYNEDVALGINTAGVIADIFDLGGARALNALTNGGTVLALAEKSTYQYLKNYGRGLGIAGLGISLVSSGYDVLTGNDNTSTLVDAGVSFGLFTAGFMGGVTAAPVIIGIGIGYGIWSVAGGSDWVNDNWGYRDTIK